MNFIGLPLIVFYFLASEDDPDEDGFWIFILLVGLLSSFYRGILSISVISDEFMISMRLMMQSIIEMFSFCCVLISQMALFAVLQSIHELDENYKAKNFDVNGYKIFGLNFLDRVMIVIGGKKLSPAND